MLLGTITGGCWGLLLLWWGLVVLKELLDHPALLGNVVLLGLHLGIFLRNGGLELGYCFLGLG